MSKAFGTLAGKHTKTHERMTKCGDYLKFAEFACNETGEVGRRRLKAASFCGHRHCPMCQWRRGALLHAQLVQVAEEHLRRHPGDRALMLTLTVENCAPDALSRSASDVTNAFRRLSDMAPVKRAVRGWFRSMEITRNAQTGYYHPHLHVLLMVPAAYFDKAQSLYIETQEWVKLWQKALRVDYAPICDVRAVGGRSAASNANALRKGLLEVTKYCTKPDDWIEFTDDAEGYRVDPDVLAQLVAGLQSKRLVGWGGTLKQIFAELQMEDVESDEANLVGDEADEVAPEGHTFVGYASYSWRRWTNGGGNYYRNRAEGLGVQSDPDPPDVTLH